MDSIITLVSSHGTRIIGLVLGTLTTLVATGIIPEGWLKYFAAAIAVLTFWRGQSVSNSFNSAVAAQSTFPPQVKP